MFIRWFSSISLLLYPDPGEPNYCETVWIRIWNPQPTPWQKKSASFSPEYKAVICAVNVVHGSQGVIYNPVGILKNNIQYPVPSLISIFHTSGIVSDLSSLSTWLSDFFSSNRNGNRYQFTTGTPSKFDLRCGTNNQLVSPWAVLEDINS